VVESMKGGEGVDWGRWISSTLNAYEMMTHLDRNSWGYSFCTS